MQENLSPPVTSEVTGKTYVPEECVFVTNLKQVTKYLQNGASVVDLFTNDNSICFVFSKKDTYELYAAWKEHRL